MARRVHSPVTFRHKTRYCQNGNAINELERMNIIFTMQKSYSPPTTIFFPLYLSRFEETTLSQWLLMAGTMKWVWFLSKKFLSMNFMFRNLKQRGPGYKLMRNTKAIIWLWEDNIQECTWIQCLIDHFYNEKMHFRNTDIFLKFWRKYLLEHQLDLLVIIATQQNAGGKGKVPCAHPSCPETLLGAPLFHQMLVRTLLFGKDGNVVLKYIYHYNIDSVSHSKMHGMVRTQINISDVPTCLLLMEIHPPHLWHSVGGQKLAKSSKFPSEAKQYASSTASAGSVTSTLMCSWGGSSDTSGSSGSMSYTISPGWSGETEHCPMGWASK